MLLHKSIGGGPTEPSYFWNIFEVIGTASYSSKRFALNILSREALILMLMIRTTVM